MIIRIILCSFLLSSAAFAKKKQEPPEVKWKTFSEYNVETNKSSDNLKKMIGKEIVVTGFMIPLDFEAKTIKEFLLVPYIPSCAHVPPPPANQTIKVEMTTKSGIKPSYYPIKVVGVTSVEKIDPKKKKKEEPSPFMMPMGVFKMKAKSVEEVKN